MKINPNLKVRKVANENFVLVSGQAAGDVSKVIALNETSLYLWNELLGKDFTLNDVVKLLTDRFDVEVSVAQSDAEKWVETFQIHGVIV